MLYLTSIDVTNNASTAVPVDFYFAGTVNGAEVFAEGTVGDFGLVARGRDRCLRAQTSTSTISRRHSSRPAFSRRLRATGVLGSVLFVFNGSTKRGQGAVAARFYNAFGGGNVGVALKGHEIAVNEPTKLIATLRDTTNGNPAGAIYPNLFINNTGLAPDGSIASGPVSVQNLRGVGSDRKRGRQSHHGQHRPRADGHRQSRLSNPRRRYQSGRHDHRDRRSHFRQRRDRRPGLAGR